VRQARRRRDDRPRRTDARRSQRDPRPLDHGRDAPSSAAAARRGVPDLTDRARLFVALDLPAAARAALGSWSEAAFAADPALRLLRPESLHVTLVFLGWRGEEEVDRIGDAALGSLAGLAVPRLSPSGVVALPRRRPRLFAVELADPADRAVAVQGAVESALVGAGFHDPEERDFWPHVTVARVRRGARPRRPDVAPLPDEAFDATEVVLYRSDTRPDGARYTPLARRSVGAAT
jgi:2'-5' RNA ligase